MSKKDLKILSNNLKLDVTLVTPEDKSLDNNFPLVITFHGMTSSKNSYVLIGEKLAGKNIATLAVSLQAHGKSEGKLNITTVEDLSQNGEDVLLFAKNALNFDFKKIGLIGTSVGANVAMSVSKQAQALLLRVPAVYDEAMMQMTCNQIMDNEDKVFKNIKDLSETHAIRKVKKFKGDLLIVQSEKDEIIPERIPQAIYNSCKKVKSKRIEMIKGADHGLSDKSKRKKFNEIVVNWFSKKLK